jgi:hypothetical protein
LPWSPYMAARHVSPTAGPEPKRRLIPQRGPTPKTTARTSTPGPPRPRVTAGPQASSDSLRPRTHWAFPDPEGPTCKNQETTGRTEATRLSKCRPRVVVGHTGRARPTRTGCSPKHASNNNASWEDPSSRPRMFGIPDAPYTRPSEHDTAPREKRTAEMAKRTRSHVPLNTGAGTALPDAAGTRADERHTHTRLTNSALRTLPSMNGTTLCYKPGSQKTWAKCGGNRKKEHRRLGHQNSSVSWRRQRRRPRAGRLFVQEGGKVGRLIARRACGRSGTATHCNPKNHPRRRHSHAPANTALDGGEKREGTPKTSEGLGPLQRTPRTRVAPPRGEKRAAH